MLVAICVAALVRTRRRVSRSEGVLLAAAALLTLILTREFTALGLILLFTGPGLERFVGLAAIGPAALACCSFPRGEGDPCWETDLSLAVTVQHAETVDPLRS